VFTVQVILEHLLGSVLFGALVALELLQPHVPGVVVLTQTLQSRKGLPALLADVRTPLGVVQVRHVTSQVTPAGQWFGTKGALDWNVIECYMVV